MYLEEGRLGLLLVVILVRIAWSGARHYTIVSWGFDWGGLCAYNLCWNNFVGLLEEHSGSGKIFKRCVDKFAKRSAVPRVKSGIDSRANILGASYRADMLEITI